MNAIAMRRWTGVVLGLGCGLGATMASAQQEPIFASSVVGQRSITPRGGGLGSGALKSKQCTANTNPCVLKVRARLSPIDIVDPDDEVECVIRVPVSAVFGSGVKEVKWELSINAQTNFEFRGPGPTDPGIVIDHDGSVWDAPVPDATRKSVTAKVKTGAKVNVSSYTIYLKWTNSAGTKSAMCAGLDPIIINRDS